MPQYYIAQDMTSIEAIIATYRWSSSFIIIYQNGELFTLESSLTPSHHHLDHPNFLLLDEAH